MLSFAGAGRVYQDNDFVISELAGYPIDRVIGLVAHDGPDDAPVAVNMLPEGATWQRFFLEAGLAFWEDYGDMVDEEDEAFRFVDYGEREQLRGDVIREVRASPVGKHGFARLVIELGSGRRIEVFFLDDDDVDADVRISITPLVAGDASPRGRSFR
jgi:hypothetical protein